MRFFFSSHAKTTCIYKSVAQRQGYGSLYRGEKGSGKTGRPGLHPLPGSYPNR
jgi:hypothetical protein